MRLTQRLLIGSLLIVSLMIVLLVTLIDRSLHRRLNDMTVEQLAKEARLVALQWSAAPNADSVADAAGLAVGHRVTLIDSAGRVVGDSEFDDNSLASLENHAERPEIRQARAGAEGSDRRVSRSVGDEELYVAVAAPFGFARVAVSTRRLETIIDRAQRDVIVAGGVALLAALVISYLFSRAVSQPIVELNQVAQAIARGELERRPPLSAPGEVGDLASALHEMAEQLASRLTALEAEDALLLALIESLHEGVVAVDTRRRVVRVNESGRRLLELRGTVPFSIDDLPRVRALREALSTALAGRPAESAEVVVNGRTLALTARPLPDGAVVAVFDLTALRRLETVRRDFVANASHELKTPITVIGGFAETLAEDDPPTAQRRQFAQTIRANAHRMQRIVDDLLDLSRIESGGWIPSPGVLDVAEAAREVFARCGRSAEEKGVELRLDISHAAPTVFADATALQQILANLIENAVRYTPARGSITVYTEPDHAGTWVGVRDTGSGIGPEHLPRIFERFYRADSARSRDGGGTGLGLAIVRHLVEAHGGRVRAESVVKQGTTVAAFFPERRIAG